MKKLLLTVALATGIGMQLWAQQSSVKILLNDEERFRFDSIRLEFINANHHVMIGDSTGMNNAANFQTFENTFIGHRAGSINQSDWNTFVGSRSGENHKFGPNNVYLGSWAGRADSSGHSNTYVGADAGENNRTGFQNTYLGHGAGVNDSAGINNVFIGYLAGRVNTSGNKNVFIGTTSGFSNTLGIENTFLGTSAGGSNTEGSFNTYIGRRAGQNNQTGSGNLFLGFYAGFNEMGSNRLYIANSSTDAPLIYGEFDNSFLRLNAYYTELTGDVMAYGRVQANDRFNVNGLPGMNDTITYVTGIDFANDLLKYRTYIYTGGILTYTSNESDWVTAVGEPVFSCGTIGLIGEFTGWGYDVIMTRNENNPDLWSMYLYLDAASDLNNPSDGIIDMKFRENYDWAVNWGSTQFPTGTGYQDGPNIPVPLNPLFTTTTYYVTFNCATGDYSFTDISQ
jgi:hypothetical protein